MEVLGVFPSNIAPFCRSGEGGWPVFSEWMKMTYAVGLRESKWSHQGYPVQQHSLWFRNCSRAESRQDVRRRERQGPSGEECAMLRASWAASSRTARPRGSRVKSGADTRMRMSAMARRMWKTRKPPSQSPVATFTDLLSSVWLRVMAEKGDKLNVPSFEGPVFSMIHFYSLLLTRIFYEMMMITMMNNALAY